MILDGDNNYLFLNISPELNICSDKFDPVKALACCNLNLPYPKSKTYNNLSEYYSYTFLKKIDSKQPISKSAKTHQFVLKRNYAWFYTTLGLNQYEGDLLRLRTKKLRKEKLNKFGKCIKDKFKNAVEIEPEMLESLQSEKIILKNLDGSSRLYLFKNGEVKKAPEIKINTLDETSVLGNTVLDTENNVSLTVEYPKKPDYIRRPLKKSVYFFHPDFRRILYNLKNKENIYTLYSLRHKTKTIRQSQCHKYDFSERCHENALYAGVMADVTNISSNINADISITKVTVEGDLNDVNEKCVDKNQSTERRDSIHNVENLPCEEPRILLNKHVSVSPDINISKSEMEKKTYKLNKLKRKQIFSYSDENTFNKRQNISERNVPNSLPDLDIPSISESNENGKLELSSVNLNNASVNDFDHGSECNKENAIDSSENVNVIVNAKNERNLNHDETRSVSTNLNKLFDVQERPNSEDIKSKEKTLLEIAREARNRVRMEREDAKKKLKVSTCLKVNENVTVIDKDFELKKHSKNQSDVSANLLKGVSRCEASVSTSEHCQSIIKNSDKHVKDSRDNTKCNVLNASDSTSLINVKDINKKPEHSFPKKLINHQTDFFESSRNKDSYSSEHVFADQNLPPVRVSIDLNLVDFACKIGSRTSPNPLKEKNSSLPSGVPFKSMSNSLKGYKIPKKKSITFNGQNVSNVKRLKTAKERIIKFI